MWMASGWARTETRDNGILESPYYAMQLNWREFEIATGNRGAPVRASNRLQARVAPPLAISARNARRLLIYHILAISVSVFDNWPLGSVP